MREYSDLELRNIMEEQGWGPPDFQRQSDEATRAQAVTFREGDLPQGPTPTRIMDEASAQGITVPREQIGAFLFCVVREMRRKPPRSWSLWQASVPTPPRHS